MFEKTLRLRRERRELIQAQKTRYSISYDTEYFRQGAFAVENVATCADALGEREPVVIRGYTPGFVRDQAEDQIATWKADDAAKKRRR